MKRPGAQATGGDEEDERITGLRWMVIDTEEEPLDGYREPVDFESLDVVDQEYLDPDVDPTLLLLL